MSSEKMDQEAAKRIQSAVDKKQNATKSDADFKARAQGAADKNKKSK